MNNRRKNISQKHSIVNQVAKQMREPREELFNKKEKVCGSTLFSDTLDLTKLGLFCPLNKMTDLQKSSAHLYII